MNTHLETFLNAYYAAMFWTEEDHLIEDQCETWELSQKAKLDSKDDAEKFLSLVEHLELDPGQLGHDFWLTRNHHGAGFWDGDYTEQQEKVLMDAVSNFKPVDIYPNDYGFLSIG